MTGPDQQQPDPTIGAPTPLPDEEMVRWKEHLADVPDLRLAKVMRLRRAIASDSYDEESALERMLGSIQSELGVLCRAETGEEY